MKGIGMGVLRNIKSSRRWCWQDKDTLELIRDSFNGHRVTTALAIYLSLTELDSNQGSDELQAYYSQISKLSGKSTSTAKFYCNQFIKIGILTKENRKIDDKTNLSNKWSLLTPSVSNKYQTSTSNNYPTSGEDDYQLLEENELEKDNKKAFLKFSETEGYKKLREKVQQLRGGKSW